MKINYIGFPIQRVGDPLEIFIYEKLESLWGDLEDGKITLAEANKKALFIRELYHYIKAHEKREDDQNVEKKDQD